METNTFTYARPMGVFYIFVSCQGQSLTGDSLVKLTKTRHKSFVV